MAPGAHRAYTNIIKTSYLYTMSSIIHRVASLLLAASFAFCQTALPLMAQNQGSIVFPDADRQVAMRTMDKLASLAEVSDNKDVPSLVTAAAKSLLGTPYVAGTLDSDWKGEQLRIFLTKTDCILFVETCLALAETAASATPAESRIDDFAARVAAMRYRTPAGVYSYSDRIHYTTEWIRRQEASLQDMTLELGGVRWNHPICFMSTHPNLYPALSDKTLNPAAAEDLVRIAEVERELNREQMTVIPLQKLTDAQKGIRSGDIICFVTKTEGLDISHVAIALVENGRVGFIHASMKEKRL
jgi:Protein of unknown function (DUF1460).